MMTKEEIDYKLAAEQLRTGKPRIMGTAYHVSRIMGTGKLIRF